MEQDTTQINELKARREAMRERLRAKCEKIVAVVEALPEPKTFLEAERAARMVILADKMVERVFSEPKAVKEAVRSRSQKAPVNRVVNAPIVTSSPEGFAVPLPPYADAKGEDEMDETRLSKTYLKLEQLAAKVPALDAEFNVQKSP